MNLTIPGSPAAGYSRKVIATDRFWRKAVIEPIQYVRDSLN
jgi:hypothetical protein